MTNLQQTFFTKMDITSQSDTVQYWNSLRPNSAIITLKLLFVSLCSKVDINYYFLLLNYVITTTNVTTKHTA